MDLTPPPHPRASHPPRPSSDLTWLDGSGDVAAASADHPQEADRGRCCDGLRRHLPAPSWSSSLSRTPRVRLGSALRGSDGSQPLQRRLPLLGGEKSSQALREIRNEYGAGMTVEAAWRECNGSTRSVPRMTASCALCDNHSVYKTGAKEIAARHASQSITFMAKYDEREGSSCHIHLSLRGADGTISFDDDERDGGRSDVFDHASWRACWRRCASSPTLPPEYQLPQRFQVGSLRADRGCVGTDNRTCALRVVGHGAGIRVENRLPGRR